MIWQKKIGRAIRDYESLLFYLVADLRFLALLIEHLLHQPVNLIVRRHFRGTLLLDGAATMGIASHPDSDILAGGGIADGL